MHSVFITYINEGKVTVSHVKEHTDPHSFLFILKTLMAGHDYTYFWAYKIQKHLLILTVRWRKTDW